ncbi:MAG: hypothetical protein GXO26_04580 [Crenarchaeota archaeon]|nr:hypothetical protein [Thermoproteota archaeon]
MLILVTITLGQAVTYAASNTLGNLLENGIKAANKLGTQIAALFCDAMTVGSGIYGMYVLGKGLHEWRRYGIDEAWRHLLMSLGFLGLSAATQYVKHYFGLANLGFLHV